MEFFFFFFASMGWISQAMAMFKIVWKMMRKTKIHRLRWNPTIYVIFLAFCVSIRKHVNDIINAAEIDDFLLLDGWFWFSSIIEFYLVHVNSHETYNWIEYNPKPRQTYFFFLLWSCFFASLLFSAIQSVLFLFWMLFQCFFFTHFSFVHI